MYLNNYLIIILLISTILISIMNLCAYGYTKPEYKAAILLEANTGKILYQFNKDKILPQASITKLMTYYVIKSYMKENSIKESDTITVGDTNFSIPGDGVKLGIKKGDIFTYKQLLQAMLIISANDSACEFGSVYDKQGKDIILSMNKDTSSLGLGKSHYYNVTGITLKNGNKKIYNVSTAYELAKLGKIIIDKYPDILQITSHRKVTIKGQTYYSTNKLLGTNNRVDGLKTGHTDEAGYCLVFTEDVTNIIGNGQPMRLFGVVLGAPSDKVRTKASLRLLNYGEKSFFNYKLVDKNELFSLKNELYENNHIMARTNQDFYLLKKRTVPVLKQFHSNLKLSGTVHKGDRIGWVSIRIGSQVIDKPVYADKDYKQKFILFRFFIHIINFFKNLF